MIDLSFLHKLDRLSLIINKRITSNYTGERTTAYTGKGLLFKDYIIYTPGDDFRSIDWKVFARSDKLFVKRYEEERNLTVHVVLDLSASMAFGKGVTKAEYASMIGLGFAYMAMKNNERFVVGTFSDKLELFKPKRGRKQLVNILDRLNQKKPVGVSNFEQSLFAYKKLINTKAYVIIISDFLYDINQIKNALYRFKQHDIRLIQVLDPVEKELQLEGDFKLRDLETNEQMRTYISPSLRKTYLSQLSDHNAAIRKACDEVGAKFLSFSTETNVFDVFYEILQDPHTHR